MGHKHLAAHGYADGRCKLQGDCADRLNIGGNIFTLIAIATGCANGKNAVFVFK